MLGRLCRGELTGTLISVNSCLFWFACLPLLGFELKLKASVCPFYVSKSAKTHLFKANPREVVHFQGFLSSLVRLTSSRPRDSMHPLWGRFCVTNMVLLSHKEWMDHFLLGAITKKGCDPDLGMASGVSGHFWSVCSAGAVCDVLRSGSVHGSFCRGKTHPQQLTWPLHLQNAYIFLFWNSELIFFGLKLFSTLARFHIDSTFYCRWEFITNSMKVSETHNSKFHHQYYRACHLVARSLIKSQIYITLLFCHLADTHIQSLLDLWFELMPFWLTVLTP